MFITRIGMIKKKGVRVRDSLPPFDDKSDDQPNDQSTHDHVTERDDKACTAYQNKHYSECRQTQQCDQSYDKRNHNFILLQYHSIIETVFLAKWIAMDNA